MLPRHFCWAAFNQKRGDFRGTADGVRYLFAELGMDYSDCSTLPVCLVESGLSLAGSSPFEMYNFFIV